MRGITYEAGPCAWCQGPIPVPRTDRRIYCSARCSRLMRESVLPPKEPRPRGRRRLHPEEDSRLIREMIAELRQAPCMDCKESFPPVCMDFDHLPGHTKLFAISTARSGSRSLKEVKEELAKCELVCSNCHRIRTANRRRKSTNLVVNQSVNPLYK